MKTNSFSLILRAFSVMIACLFIATWSFMSTCYADTAYYVDPNYNGSTRNGGQTTPWRDTELNWTTINTALASENVTIYFSCANYTGNAEKTSTTAISIDRTSTSNYRLTLDGNSYYNTSQTAPASWSANPGSYGYQITKTSVIIGQAEAYWNTKNPNRSAAKYITIKGFHLVGNGSNTGIMIQGIDHALITQNVLDRCRIYHTYSCVAGSIWNGGVHDVTVSYNTITGPTGNEGFYFGGQDDSVGCESVWDTDITVEYNTISGATRGDGDGDGLDLKAGKQNLIVRYNTIYNNQDHGIASHSGGTYYGNIVYGNGENGLRVAGYLNWGVRPANVTMYNNVIYNNTGTGLAVQKDAGDAPGTVRIYNNSVRNSSGTNIAIETCTDLYLKNNITSAGGSQLSVSSVSNTYGGYNDFYGSISGYTRKTGDINVDPKFTSSTDLTLQSSSPCIKAGTDLTSEGGFSIDYLIHLRPAGAWDMGAYVYGGGGDTTPPAKPKNLQIIGN